MSISLMSVIGLVKGAVGLVSPLATLFGGGLTGITIDSAKSILGTALPYFEELGATIAPSAGPDIHGVLGAIAALADDNDVLAAQRLINDVGTHVTGWKPIDEDGQYGPQTAAGVTMVQVFLKINPDGWFGAITAKAVNAFMVSQSKVRPDAA